jgi:hypothetical protein
VGDPDAYFAVTAPELVAAILERTDADRRQSDVSCVTVVR